jgi:hypothetical protein
MVYEMGQTGLPAIDRCASELYQAEHLIIMGNVC